VIRFCTKNESDSVTGELLNSAAFLDGAALLGSRPWCVVTMWARERAHRVVLLQRVQVPLGKRRSSE
jgi:hypothetical protein